MEDEKTKDPRFQPTLANSRWFGLLGSWKDKPWASFPTCAGYIIPRLKTEINLRGLLRDSNLGSAGLSSSMSQKKFWWDVTHCRCLKLPSYMVKYLRTSYLHFHIFLVSFQTAISSCCLMQVGVPQWESSLQWYWVYKYMLTIFSYPPAT